MKGPVGTALPYFNRKCETLFLAIGFFYLNDHWHHHLIKILNGDGSTIFRFVVLIFHTLHRLIQLPVVEHPFSPEPAQVFTTCILHGMKEIPGRWMFECPSSHI